MIPKVIHYCWFGEKEKSQDVINYIHKWKKFNPDYEIKEWNESNFNVKINEYVKEAYNAHKWAFVSDYARLYALYNYGGIYLDTDVEVVKSFDSVLNNIAFIGVESKYSLCTATLGAEKNSTFIKDIIESYNGEHFIVNGKVNKKPNSQRVYELLTNKYGYEYVEDTIQNLDKCRVYPSEYFSPINCYTYKEKITDNTISIHRYAGTWKDKKEKSKDKLIAFFTRIIGESTRNCIKKKLKRR